MSGQERALRRPGEAQVAPPQSREKHKCRHLLLHEVLCSPPTPCLSSALSAHSPGRPAPAPLACLLGPFPRVASWLRLSLPHCTLAPSWLFVTPLAPASHEGHDLSVLPSRLLEDAWSSLSPSLLGGWKARPLGGVAATQP